MACRTASSTLVTVGSLRREEGRTTQLTASPSRPLGGSDGNDSLTGGTGADTFAFDQAPGTANADTVADFVSGADRIQLDASVMGALGLLLAAATGKILSGILYGVGALDPVAFTAAPILLATAALVATWLPARRAASLNLVKALRYE